MTLSTNVISLDNIDNLKLEIPRLHEAIKKTYNQMTNGYFIKRSYTPS